MAVRDVQARMEAMYRPQVRIYDLSRRYYLIGRDRLIDGLAARPGERLLEIGCGTGRNLRRAGVRYPGTALYGIDAAAVMLEAAGRKAAKAGLAGRIHLARADAETLAPGPLFGLTGGVDHVIVAYAFSMMDRPVIALERALRALRPGGRLHVVDFGDMAGLPGPCRAALTWWLARFGVRHRPELGARLVAGAETGRWQLQRERLLGGYAELFRVTPATDC